MIVSETTARALLDGSQPVHVVEHEHAIDPGCRCGSCWTATGELTVSAPDDTPLTEADRQLMTMARDLAVTVVHLYALLEGGCAA
jgi:hypothetical protein